MEVIVFLLVLSAVLRATFVWGYNKGLKDGFFKHLEKIVKESGIKME